MGLGRLETGSREIVGLEDRIGALLEAGGLEKLAETREHLCLFSAGPINEGGHPPGEGSEKRWIFRQRAHGKKPSDRFNLFQMCFGWIKNLNLE